MVYLMTLEGAIITQLKCNTYTARHGETRDHACNLIKCIHVILQLEFHIKVVMNILHLDKVCL